ncbi:MAG: DUF4388 domain-containing protein [Candidatus Cryosericum sp.]
MELRGTLSDFSLEAILGLIQSGHKTGVLHLEVVTPLGATRTIALSFHNGEISSAECGSTQGLAAIREAAICTEGAFEFTVDGTLPASEETTALAMDAVLATLTEAREALSSLGATLPKGTTLKYAIPADETIHLSAEEFNLLAVMHDAEPVEELVAAAPMPTADAMRIIDQLLDRGLLAIGAAVPVIGQMDWAGALSLAEQVGGKMGADIFSRFFRPGTPVSEWQRALPEFRSAFQSLVGPDKASEVVAGLRELTG